jgi:NADP-dependent 3-hydroxy acid dehydrogenase YdfG
VPPIAVRPPSPAHELARRGAAVAIAARRKDRVDALAQDIEQASEPRHVADLVNISSVAGRIARRNSGAYNLTKHGVGAFSESLRQEVTGRHVRVSLVEPGAVATDLAGHIRDEIRDAMMSRVSGIEQLEAEDISDAIAYIVTRPRRVAINELLIRPTEQEG